MIIPLAHKIELIPNNKQKTYFLKAIGCARFAYNWGLSEWERKHKAGLPCSAFQLQKEFNAIKHTLFPFVCEVTKWACAQSLRDLENAYRLFFKKTSRKPTMKKKRDNDGSFYIAGQDVELSDVNRNSKAIKKTLHNTDLKRQYIKVPKLGWVKMSERLRFQGKLKNVVISQEGDKFYASFSMEITKEEYNRTHKQTKKEGYKAVGIDLGIKSIMVLSDGICIQQNIKPLKDYQKRIKRIERQLEKKVHAKTKQEKISGIQKSKNYQKQSLRLRRVMNRVEYIRNDFSHKATSIITSYYSYIAIEDLDVEQMKKKRMIARLLPDAPFGRLRIQLKYKSAIRGVHVVQADQYFPSSKTCSVCGTVNTNLQLKDRVFDCPRCGSVIDRDYNASINLLHLINKVGVDNPELTPADLTALQYLFTKNGIATSKVETGRRQVIVP